MQFDVQNNATFFYCSFCFSLRSFYCFNMDEKKALFKYSALCSKSEHCEYDIREKMRRTDLTPEQQQRIISFLRKEKYIDDVRYAAVFVRDKLQFNGWGEQKIRFELHRRQIDNEAISKAFDEVDNALFSQKLLKAMQAKMRSAHDTDPYKLRAQLMRFGASKGFSFEQISAVVDEVMKTIDIDND